MTKLCEIEIQNAEDRRTLCAILATNGYAAACEEREKTKANYWQRKITVVVVYDKKE